VGNNMKPIIGERVRILEGHDGLDCKDLTGTIVRDEGEILGVQFDELSITDIRMRNEGHTLHDSRGSGDQNTCWNFPIHKIIRVVDELSPSLVTMREELEKISKAAQKTIESIEGGDK
jgi:hypothetical protein